MPTGSHATWITLDRTKELGSTVTDPFANDMHSSKPAAKRSGLGRGLDALIPPAAAAAPETSIFEIEIDAISANPRQPRATFDEGELALLSESLRTHGMIQPVVVRQEPDGRYTLIAGERRWRAAARAGLARIPAVVMDVTLQQQLEMALVENVVRSDLSPLEEALAYRQLIEEFGLTQAEVAARVGRSRVSVTNTLRLLSLPDRIKEALETGEISEGHARALLGLATAVDQLAMLDAVLAKGWSVRETEHAVRAWIDRSEQQLPSQRRPARTPRPEFEQRLRRALATNVTIGVQPNGSGTIRIEFGSDEQLDELIRKIAGDAIF